VGGTVAAAAARPAADKHVNRSERRQTVRQQGPADPTHSPLSQNTTGSTAAAYGIRGGRRAGR